jgi:hypothetical protein
MIELLQSAVPTINEIVGGLIIAGAVSVITFAIDPILPENITEKRDYWWYRIKKRAYNKKVPTRIVVSYRSDGELTQGKAKEKLASKFSQQPTNDQFVFNKTIAGEEIETHIEMKYGRELITMPDQNISQQSMQITGFTVVVELSPTYSDLRNGLFNANDHQRDIETTLAQLGLEKEHSSIMCELATQPIMSEFMGKIGVDYMKGRDNDIEVELVDNEFRVRGGPDTPISELVSKIVDIAIIYA